MNWSCLAYFNYGLVQYCRNIKRNWNKVNKRCILPNNWDQSGNKIPHMKFPILLSFHYNSIMNYNVNTVFKLSFSVQI